MLSEKKSFLRGRVLAIRSIYWNKPKRQKICIFIPTTTEYRNAKRIFIFTLDKAKIATLAPGL